VADDASAGFEASGAEQRPVAYIMSRFPKLTETFVLDELVAVDRQGVRIELFPLLRERAEIVHPEALPWMERAHYLPFLSAAIFRSNVRLLVRHPRRYLGTLAAMIRGTAGSLNVLVGGIGIFPKVVLAASQMSALGVRHVHCHFATHPALAGFLIHRLTGIPYSFTAHGSDLHVERRMLCQKIAESAFAVTISRSNAAVIAKECGGSVPKLQVIRCGVDLRRFRPADERDASAGAAEATDLPTGVTTDAEHAVPDPALRDRPPAITCIGTLHEVKGQRHLIAALATLAERGVNVCCRFVGDGPDRVELEGLVDKLGLRGSVEFLGQRMRSDVLELLAETDILVAPSVPTSGGKREGLPVVLIEAMAAGVPVVASHLSGIPELVENEVTGLTVPPGDPAAIADALARLLADRPLRQRLARAGRERIETEYDLDRNAARLVGLFAGSAA
jgi:colanic acid/amylovoran biosynthesis glycosyltransferase